MGLLCVAKAGRTLSAAGYSGPGSAQVPVFTGTRAPARVYGCVVESV